MNTHAEYRRHAYRPPEQAPTAHDNAVETTQLARHRDPSLAAATAPAPRKKGVTWMRPTELATYAAPTIGPGIDLQAELIRRARRTPITTTRAVRQRLHRSPSPTPPVNRPEGPSL